MQQCKQCTSSLEVPTASGTYTPPLPVVSASVKANSVKAEQAPADALALMQQEHEKRVKKEQEFAAKRALERVTCSKAAAAAAAGGSKKQKMAQSWVVLSEEVEEEGSRNGEDFSDRDC